MNATDDPEEILAHDLVFHREIASAAGNETMAAIHRALAARDPEAARAAAAAHVGEAEEWLRTQLGH